ncbi:MAG TPA: cyclopropane-fatty-acyl-phospholipid synthase family protein [Coriobacteriia bacterium]|nr:cyclopropane-fatty-acyl-phospholipid synthase family protein [Coriobacteriia bacterium]
MSRTLAEMVAEMALSRLSAGELEVVRRDGSSRTMNGSDLGGSATVVVKTPAAARRAVTAGAIGVAEGYMRGDWDTPDLDAVLELGANHVLHDHHTVRSVRSPWTRLLHRLRDNSLTGSRRNIAAHYDLGNDFYSLWLDETMTYSSALYDEPAADLLGAQRRKWDRLLEVVQPSRKDHLLEIGCGWGGFALHAAKEAGCKVTGLTLSQEQAAWASQAVQRAGLEGLVDVRIQDYRRVDETFSAIVSIEMFEAVGERWWPTFFQRVRDLLPDKSVAAIQTITIGDDRFEDYRDNPDFIQRYIFPGGMLPSPERFTAAAAEQGLVVDDAHYFGHSYAATLAEWSRRFEAALPAVRALGFDEEFVRMWRYYLAYCRAGFSAGTVDVMQVRLET